MNAAETFERTMPLVRWHVRRLAGRLGVATDVVDDMVADALLAFWRVDYPRIVDESSRLGFARMRARWTVASAGADYHRRVRRVSTTDNGELPEAESGEATPEEEAAVRLLSPRVASALASLEEHERAAVLAGLEHGGLTDLAAERGVNPSQPTRWQRNGLARLRAALGVVLDDDTDGVRVRDAIRRFVSKSGKVHTRTIARKTGLDPSAVTTALHGLGYRPVGNKGGHHWLPPTRSAA